MAYNLSSEGAEQNRNSGYTAPTNYGGPGAPATSGTVAPVSKDWKEYAKLYQYDALPDDLKLTPFQRRNSSNWENGSDVEIMREKILAASAKRGITQPEFEWMKRTGNAYLLTPDVFQESSKEWFNKPYNNDGPQAIEFRKVLLANDKDPFHGGRDIYEGERLYAAEFGKLYANELTDEDKALARKEKIDFTTPQGVYQIFQNRKQTATPAPTGTAASGAVSPASSELPSTPYTPRNATEAENMPGAGGTGLAGPNPNAAADAAALAASEQAWNNDPATLAARARYSSGGPGQTPRQEREADRVALANWNADHNNWTAAGAIAAKNATNTFLPPYLQPGTSAAGAPGMAPTIPLPVPAPLAPPGSPITPFVPQGGIAPLGSPLTPFVPQTTLPGAMAGGFAKTAKLLELPFYLRSLYGGQT